MQLFLKAPKSDIKNIKQIENFLNSVLLLVKVSTWEVMLGERYILTKIIRQKCVIYFNNILSLTILLSLITFKNRTA